MRQNLFVTFFIILIVASCSVENKNNHDNEIDTGKPYTYWWWPGNATDTANLAYNLEMMDSAGIGGAHIIPIYGVKGYEDRFIKYLSPEWTEMVKYASRKAGDLGMEIDMTLGTGWCFGGSWVDKKNGVMGAGIEKIENINGGRTFNFSSPDPYQFDTLLCVIAELKNGDRIDITSSVADQNLEVPDSIASSTIYFLRMFATGRMVKRPAPGAEGPMLNPLSANAFREYVKPFDNAFPEGLGKYISSVYHDSYEYSGAKWSFELFDRFEAERGYKLQYYLPELYDKGETEISRRIIADYRQTVFELHRDYIKAVKEWAGKNSVTFRNQSHGSPSNWLDIYAVADIPETESFGSSPFNISGFERDSDFISISNVPDKDVYRFASSAANVTGKSLISCETHTWLREHFRVALSHCKPELDKLFVSGINHVYYHGTAYSPKEEKWPGWLFYASTNFAPSNSQYAHFRAQNNYIENCQELLQSAQPDNEIAVYFPFQDILHNCNVDKDISLTINVHNPSLWFYDSEFEKTLSLLEQNGFCYDYISDLQLIDSKEAEGMLKTTGNKYNTLVIPQCEYMSVETIKKIHELAEAGTKIIFIEDMPYSYSGYSPGQKTGMLFESLRTKLQEMNVSNLQIIDREELSSLLVDWGNKKEEFPTYDLDFIRKKDGKNFVYFISNLNSGKEIDRYISLGISSESYVIYDPLTGERGLARVRKEDERKSVLLQLKQGESVFIIASDEDQYLAQWVYTGSPRDKFKLTDNWKLGFLEGGPVLPKTVNINELVSWTELPDSMASYFSGLAGYSTSFNLDNLNSDCKYFIDFEEVHESVMIRLNGREVTTLFSHPYETDITKFLKEGENHLELEVANLPANRIRYLDRQGVNWKKFYNINFVSINYSGFDASKWDPVKSGLSGDVSIVCYKKGNK